MEINIVDVTIYVFQNLELKTNTTFYLWERAGFVVKVPQSGKMYRRIKVNGRIHKFDLGKFKGGLIHTIIDNFKNAGYQVEPIN